MYFGGPMNRSIECYTAMKDNGRSRAILSSNEPSLTTPSELLPYRKCSKKNVREIRNKKNKNRRSRNLWNIIYEPSSAY